MKKSERVVTGALTFDLNEHGKRTRILDTLRPATESEEVLQEMICAGMDVSRINFSHVSRDTRLPRVFTPAFQHPPFRHLPEAIVESRKARILWSLLASRPAQVLGREPKEASALPGFAPR
jgi:hypothetical protein